ncbi:nucleotidyltransferase domain-containing protein [Candidatus Bathyarchaeota archaeon]|nr:nucleotidyltransferase domain-containing protein [Candidatus Bathyarchaeota archaeon]
MSKFQSLHTDCLVYGSIARGDVNFGSDIDIFFPSPPSPEIIETNIEIAGFESNQRQIIQATPNYAAKGYIFLDELTSYSFPLVPLRSTEMDFYTFAGSLSLQQLLESQRVLGVDKRLMLIEPTKDGHVESEIIGREGEVAKLLNVDPKIVNERVRTLLRRNKVGHTGVYLKRELSPEESFSDVFNTLIYKYPALRRRLRK